MGGLRLGVFPGEHSKGRWESSDRDGHSLIHFSIDTDPALSVAVRLEHEVR